MDELESMGFGYSYCLFEDLPGESARGYVGIYFSKSGVLEA